MKYILRTMLVGGHTIDVIYDDFETAKNEHKKNLDFWIQAKEDRLIHTSTFSYRLSVLAGYQVLKYEDEYKTYIKEASNYMKKFNKDIDNDEFWRGDGKEI